MSLFKELLWPAVQIRVFSDGDKSALLNHVSQQHLNKPFQPREREKEILAFLPMAKTVSAKMWSSFFVFQKDIYCQFCLFIYLIHCEEESFIKKFTWENQNYCDLFTNGLLTTGHASVSWIILICHGWHTRVCKETIKQGLLLVFFLEMVDKPCVGFSWFLKVDKACLWTCCISLEEENKLQNAAKGASNWILIWCLKSLMRFLVCGSFLMPGNEALLTRLYMVKLNEAQNGCIAKDEAELNISSILICALLTNSSS